MYIQVSRSIFYDAFQGIRPGNFNYYGLSALFEYLTDMDSEDDIELDVIAICCDFCQYDSIEEACDACGVEDREELEGQTIVLDCGDGSVVVKSF